MIPNIETFKLNHSCHYQILASTPPPSFWLLPCHQVAKSDGAWQFMRLGRAPVGSFVYLVYWDVPSSKINHKNCSSWCIATCRNQPPKNPRKLHRRPPTLAFALALAFAFAWWTENRHFGSSMKRALDPILLSQSEPKSLSNSSSYGKPVGTRVPSWGVGSYKPEIERVCLPAVLSHDMLFRTCAIFLPCYKTWQIRVQMPVSWIGCVIDQGTTYI